MNIFIFCFFGDICLLFIGGEKKDNLLGLKNKNRAII